VVSGDRSELMKINLKKTNPAFKLRQVLPQLPNLSGRAGAAAQESPQAAPNQNSGTGVPASTWVTTE